jgi:hypothetical protein
MGAAVTLPHVRDGLSGLWMAVLCPFRRPSMVAQYTANSCVTRWAI